MGYAQRLSKMGIVNLDQPMLTQIYVATWHMMLSPAGLQIPNTLIANAWRNGKGHLTQNSKKLI